MIFALGIRQVGQATARLLALHFDDPGAMMAALAPDADIDATISELIAIDQVGDSMAADLVAFFANDTNRAAVEDLLSQLRVVPPERPSEDSPVSGKTIVFTGTLSGMSRAEAKARAEGLGASVGIRIGEDRLSGCRRRRGIESPQGGRARRHRSRRGGMAGPDLRLAKAGKGSGRRSTMEHRRRPARPEPHLALQLGRQSA